MKKLVGISVALLFIGAYFAYQRPEIRVLFEETENTGDSLDFLNDLPEISPRVKQKREKKDPVQSRQKPLFAEESRQTEASESEPVQPPQVAENQVPNSETSRVLMQILKAKGLASGISIGVSDESIMVFGKVNTLEEKQEILQILEKGRETREIVASELKIESSN